MLALALFLLGTASAITGAGLAILDHHHRRRQARFARAVARIGALS